MADLDETLDLLAAEYVLGTLEGEARADVERRLSEEPALQARVTVWEERLVGFDRETMPRTPSAAVWRAIESQLDAHQQQPAQRWWQLSGFWRGLVAAAALSLAVVAVVPMLPQFGSQAPVWTLTMEAAGQSPQWHLQVDWRDRRLTATRIDAQRRTRHDYQLWLLPAKQGGAPISLGLLRGTQVQAQLPKGTSWRDTKAFAVSLEPLGGSPTGLPTGPVLYAANAPKNQS